MQFEYVLKIWLCSAPDGQEWRSISYKFPGQKIRGGVDSFATSDNAAIVAASGSWAYLQYPASANETTAAEYGQNDELECLAQAMQEFTCCGELWRRACFSKGMPPKRIQGFVALDAPRGGKWNRLDAVEILKKIS